MEFFIQIHLKIIHFPIALLCVYPFIELLYFITQKEYYNKTAFLFLAIGISTALFAVLSGNRAAEIISSWQSDSKQIFEQHQLYANITVWFFSALLGIRFIVNKKYSSKRIIPFIFFIISLFGLFAIYQTGHYGNLLSKQITINSQDIVK
ncbi:MAG: DUF2231 domain-containing protein [Ignavibacteriaceae bacterium]|jgi:uncharacterized membrane protein|nr:hypothetical protein [Ignavibacterium sp.]MDX9712273.1 hypothetical protein [Ignavibacteriaceae bacterium]MEB2353717.1 hypothetical protein [Ignavibacteriales bacterium]GIK22333.1 MAG: hypothetical protein BroJett005_17470 [Ignavibacteriota bacterium]HMN18321.1 hypothetical protein [Ignavibacteriaceae bacterium]